MVPPTRLTLIPVEECDLIYRTCLMKRDLLLGGITVHDFILGVYTHGISTAKAIEHLRVQVATPTMTFDAWA